MKRPSLLEGAGFGFLLSAAGAVALGMTTLIFGSSGSLRLAVAAVALAYVVYLLARSRERTGRISVLATWSGAAVLAWWFAPSLVVYISIHVVLIWLVRALYFHAGPLSALLDLGLNGLALAVAVWSVMHTHSIFLALWCFFLVQSLFVLIPPHWRRSARDGAENTVDRFEHAHRAALSALQRIHTIR